MKTSAQLRERRKSRQRFKISDSVKGKHRMVINRTNNHMYAQILDETGTKTIIEVSTLSKDVKGDNLFFIQGDLYSSDVRNKALEFGPYDSVICDAAPPTTGNRVVDTARSSGLVELAIFYAEIMLKKGGNFVVKIFQGGDQQAFLKKMREIFTSAKGFKPEACRNESFETYLVGLGKK